MTPAAGTEDPLRHLSPLERDCLLRYCALLRERLGGSLLRLVLFGSAARGDMWDAGFAENLARDGVDLAV